MSDLNKKLKQYRLSRSEYERVCKLLDREPKGVEWALFSALWSEHCSYKSSRKHLKNIYRDAPQVLESFGENAGIIDLGEGEKLAFKMESHNHPSFIEPFQGAATGVGGILRDIFTMGARPIALANYLCFGEPKANRMSALVDGVVLGIGSYGNCVGVPTITGQTEFHSSYNNNILVNAMAVGYFGPNDPICISRAKGIGNWVVYVGAKTGRDGVHGASMASESFGEDSASKRPTVQIGDPFFEKLLIESCLEVMKKDLVVAIQDMGAAGLTSSSFEMASKGHVGMRVDLDLVPLRDSSVGPEEILLSESQERMLLICEPRKFEALKKEFDIWGLDATKIGEIIKEKRMKLYWQGDLLTDIDPDLLVDNAPQYERPYKEWKAKNRVVIAPKQNPPLHENSKVILELLSDVRGCSRKWIYRQYDQHVGTRTERESRDSVAVQRLDHTSRRMGMAVGCRPHVMRFDAYVGGIDSVAYPAMELALKGFKTLAVTDCLNFGNPENSEIMTEFVGSLNGMSKMCEALVAPIISGNVSFYNETQGQNITSTPSTGLVGLRSDNLSLPTDYFVNAGENVFVITLPQVYFEGMIAESKGATLGSGDLVIPEIAKFTDFLRENSQFYSSSRIVGKFGLGYALARMALGGVGLHAEIKSEIKNGIFNETLYQVIVSVKSENADKLMKAAKDKKYNIEMIGLTGGARLLIEDIIDVKTTDLERAYTGGWRKNFETLA
jgi:phosphoribosylformylglycinamidine synthase subunit PurL